MIVVDPLLLGATFSNYATIITFVSVGTIKSPCEITTNGFVVFEKEVLLPSGRSSRAHRLPFALVKMVYLVPISVCQFAIQKIDRRSTDSDQQVGHGHRAKWIANCNCKTIQPTILRVSSTQSVLFCFVFSFLSHHRSFLFLLLDNIESQKQIEAK